MNILFVCTSNKDRSPALEKHFREIKPDNEYRSAGINRYHTQKKGTHYITQEDIDWADMIIYAEYVHYVVVSNTFVGANEEQKLTTFAQGGEYVQDQINNEYIKRVENNILELI